MQRRREVDRLDPNRSRSSSSSSSSRSSHNGHEDVLYDWAEDDDGSEEDNNEYVEFESDEEEENSTGNETEGSEQGDAEIELDDTAFLRYEKKYLSI